LTENACSPLLKASQPPGTPDDPAAVFLPRSVALGQTAMASKADKKDTKKKAAVRQRLESSLRRLWVSVPAAVLLPLHIRAVCVLLMLLQPVPAAPQPAGQPRPGRVLRVACGVMQRRHPAAAS